MRKIPQGPCHPLTTLTFMIAKYIVFTANYHYRDRTWGNVATIRVFAPQFLRSLLKPLRKTWVYLAHAVVDCFSCHLESVKEGVQDTIRVGKVQADCYYEIGQAFGGYGDWEEVGEAAASAELVDVCDVSFSVYADWGSCVGVF